MSIPIKSISLSRERLYNSNLLLTGRKANHVEKMIKTRGGKDIIHTSHLCVQNYSSMFFRKSSARFRSSGVSIPTVSTSVIPTLMR